MSKIRASKKISNLYHREFHKYVLSQPEWKRRKNVGYVSFIKGISDKTLHHKTKSMIISLAAFSMQCERRYQSQKENGTAPKRLEILDNLAQNSRDMSEEPLRSNLGEDCVYNLLLDIDERTEEIAIKQYSKNLEDPKEAEEDLEVTISNKLGFIGKLRGYMIERGPEKDRIYTSDWERDAIISERNYNFLDKKAKDDDRDKFIQTFVSYMPSYPWEGFSWDRLFISDRVKRVA